MTNENKQNNTKTIPEDSTEKCGTIKPQEIFNTQPLCLNKQLKRTEMVL